MTPAAWVATMTARTNATPREARRVLASLGVITAPDAFDPLPTGCGHPSTELRRRATGVTGFECAACMKERAK